MEHQKLMDDLEDAAVLLESEGFDCDAGVVRKAIKKLDEKDKELKLLYEIVNDALISFKCTQKVADYPASCWSNRAEKLLTGIKPETKGE